MSARLVVRDEGAVIIISIDGKLASDDRQYSLQAQLRKLAGKGRFCILLDLSGVPTLDSEDIGELMAGHAEVSLAGGELKLLKPGERVSAVLRATRISDMIESFSNEETALRSFARVHTPRVKTFASSEPRSEWYYG